MTDLGDKTNYTAEQVAPRQDDPSQPASAEQLLKGMVGHLNGIDFDEEGVDPGAAYAAVTLADLDQYDGAGRHRDLEQDSDGWIVVRSRQSLSLAVEAVGQNADVEVQYKLSAGDTGQQLAELANVVAGARDEVVRDEPLDGIAQIRIRAKYNTTDGGTLNLRGVIQ